MTRFGQRIVPITSPSPGGCATGYATDAGYILSILPRIVAAGGNVLKPVLVLEDVRRCIITFTM